MKRIRTLVALLVAIASGLVASSQPAGAQSTPFDTLRTETAKEIQGASSRTLGLANDQMYVAMLARRQSALLRLLIRYEEERSDEQIGATSSASGTTTLVSKGTVPKILAFAVENGALTRTQSGTTVTFRGNLGGAVRALAGLGLFQLTQGEDPALGLLRRASFSTSFDTSRGTGGSGDTLTGDQQQLSQWTFRWQLVNHRDPQGAQSLEKWRSNVNASQVGLAQVTLVLNQRLGDDDTVTRWLADTVTKVSAAKAAATTAKKTDAAIAADIEDALKAQESSFPIALHIDTLAALDAWDRSASAFVTERHNLLQDLKAGALVAFEYTSDRPLKAPKTSSLRLVGEVGGSVDLTGNASVTLFDGDVPLGASGRVRDFQVGGEMDIKMGSADTVGAFVLALSGKYVRQLENSYSDAGLMMPDTKGTIAIGQLKLTIPTKGTGVKIPLSITVANRTELVKEAIVRANVGVTYDLDSVFAKFRP